MRTELFERRGVPIRGGMLYSVHGVIQFEGPAYLQHIHTYLPLHLLPRWLWLEHNLSSWKQFAFCGIGPHQAAQNGCCAAYMVEAPRSSDHFNTGRLCPQMTAWEVWILDLLLQTLVTAVNRLWPVVIGLLLPRLSCVVLTYYKLLELGIYTWSVNTNAD